MEDKRLTETAGIVSKEDIKKKYTEIRDSLGTPPTLRQFNSRTHYSKRTMQKHFGSNSFQKLAVECGDSPRSFKKPKTPLEDILLKYGELALKIGKLPTEADWEFYNYKPSVSGITKSHKIKWSELPNKFSDFSIGKKELNEVIKLLPNSSPILKEYRDFVELPQERLQFIPPAVAKLIEYSFDETKSREFEKNVNLLFQMLGFEVIEYGQGTGRNPDSIAKEMQHRYAILIDAKSRSKSYKIGTEDRKFIEYIKTFSERLKHDGFEKIFFLIVSSSFDQRNKSAIENIKLETQVPVTFITARMLLKLLSIKIEKPKRFCLKNFQRYLIDDGLLLEEKIDNFGNRT